MSVSATFIESRGLAPGLRRFSPRQEEVLDVVEAVFLREGIRGLRMGQLAAEASCSRSTLYELAPSKEDLLLLVLDRMMRRIMRRGGEAIAQAEDPVEKIRAMMTSGALDFGTFGPRFLDAIQQHAPARMLFDRRIAEGLDVLEHLIDDAVGSGDFRAVNASVIAEAIFVVVLRFTQPDPVRSTDTSPAAKLAELIDVLLDGLRPRP
jgi:AcrR family transcriptional regulator